MATINSLVFDIEANTAKLKSGLAESQTKISQWSKANHQNIKAVENAFNTAAKAVVALGASAATGLGALVLSTAASAKEIRNLSRVANTGTTDFQRFAQAAKTVGFETDKTADILKDMNDRVGDFIQTGGGPLVDFFEQIAPKVGVTADQFRGLSGADALQLYVSSLEKANLSQADMVFYMEAIASDSTALLPLLTDNGKALNALGDAAERSGAVIDEINLQKLGEVSGAVNKMQMAWEGVKNQVVLGAVPAINDFMTLMTDEATLKNASLLGNAVVTSINTAISAISTAAGMAKWLGEEIAAITGGVAPDDIVRLQDLRAQVVQAIDNPSERVRFFGPGGVIEYWNEEELNAELARLDLLIEQYYDRKMNKPIVVSKGAIEPPKLAPTGGFDPVASSALKDWLADLKDAEATFGMTNEQIEVYKAKQLGASDADIKRLQSLQGANKAMQDTLAIQEEMDRAFEQQKAYEANLGLRKYAESAKDLTTILNDGAVRALQGMEDGFISLIKGTESVADSFKSMASSIIDDLIRIQIQRSITQPLANMMSGFSLFGGTKGPTAADMNLFSFDGGGFTGMGSRSGGVDGKGGFPAILHPNETVMDHTKGQSGGGVTVVQNINISTGVQQTVRNEIAQLMPQIANASKAAVLDAKRRGGSFSAAFGG